MIIPPIRRPIDNPLERSWVEFFEKIGLFAGTLDESGTTANRPTTKLWVGRMYFDTTLGYPIWIKSLGPTVWVDAAGTTV